MQQPPSQRRSRLVTSVSAPRSLPAALLRTLRTDRWALAGAIVIVVLVFVAAAAPLLAAIQGAGPDADNIAPPTPNGGLPAGPLGGISGAHWFGVEPLTGRDLFARVCYGARTSF